MFDRKCPSCGGKLEPIGDNEIVVTKDGTRIRTTYMCGSCGRSVERTEFKETPPDMEIHIGGSVGSMKVAPGDLIEGDVYNVGPIIGSTGVVIGRQKQMTKVTCPHCHETFMASDSDLTLGFSATGPGEWTCEGIRIARLKHCPLCGAEFKAGDPLRQA